MNAYAKKSNVVKWFWGLSNFDLFSHHPTVGNFKMACISQKNNMPASAGKFFFETMVFSGVVK